MNRELGQPIALGRTAKIYAWQDGQVLKLFHNWFALEDIEYEARLGRAVHAAGLPVPAVGEIVQVGGRDGLLYQRVDGPSMFEAFATQPWRVLAFARRTAELHAEMHTANILPDIPSQRRRLERKINGADLLPASHKQAALSALSELPDGDRLCHGDFHPGNILLTSQDAVIIDWIDAARGNPLADVARTSIIALGTAATSQIPNRTMKAFVRLFHAAYLRRYFRLRPDGEDEYRRWLPVVAAARLSEGMAELEGWLMEQARRGLTGVL